MDVWFSLPMRDAAALKDLVTRLDTTGIAGVTVSDHLSIPSELESGYPYGGGRPPVFPTDTAFCDPLSLIASLAELAPTLRFMSSVLLAPMWHPLLLARQAATVAATTDGRLDLGVGAGWMREEYEALGIAFEHRGARLDEAIRVLRLLWSGEAVAHAGAHFAFSSLRLTGVPAEPIPILAGGHARRALRRAALHADGWVGVNPTLNELTQIIDELREHRGWAGTADRPFVVRTGIKGDLTDQQLAGMHALEVDSLVVMMWQLPHALREADASAASVADAVSEIVGRVRALGFDQPTEQPART